MFSSKVESQTSFRMINGMAERAHSAESRAIRRAGASRFRSAKPDDGTSIILFLVLSRSGLRKNEKFTTNYDPGENMNPKLWEKLSTLWGSHRKLDCLTLLAHPSFSDLPCPQEVDGSVPNGTVRCGEAELSNTLAQTDI